jgi:hypothetical protein
MSEDGPPSEHRHRRVLPNESKQPRGHGVGYSNEEYLYWPTDDIIICFDGTWCGKATGTTGNIKIIADSFAAEGAELKGLIERKDRNGQPTFEYRRGSKRYVRYFEGPGLEGTFADYVTNGESFRL